MRLKNKFCNLKDLTNESQVEHLFVDRLLSDLGFQDRNIKTKTSLQELVIGRGSMKENYKPDYVLFVGKLPKVVIDAKDPEENLNKWLYQVSGYALAINQKYKDNPVLYTILTNGVRFNVYRWDEEKPVLSISFDEFENNTPKYQKLEGLISYKALSVSQTALINNELFDFKRLNLDELDQLFVKCHRYIWKKDKIKPVEAFYEFSKFFFVKIFYDRQIHEMIQTGKSPKKQDFIFSVEWLESMEKVNPDPINILFEKIRNNMEKDIKTKKKKRIFDQDERIKVRPSTIKEVVKLVEHLDLFGIDEDLNGRMFESFLTATIRGRDLGQFFTPRGVIKFMVSLADIKVKKEEDTSLVVDACCGSGGFLIEVMADMWKKIDSKGLTDIERKKFKDYVVGNCIYGIDADKRISRIARMNMSLHGDGSNKIYWLSDSLDKKILIEEGIEDELKDEAKEFKELVKTGLLFDVALTNPPFAMRYDKDESDEKEKMEQYEIAKREGSNDLIKSIKSNVLFIERYHDLLKEGGTLITVIDDSVLNGINDKKFRDWIKKKFIIKAIISLPFNTFKVAGSGVKTSILYLKKREAPDEEQSRIFMGVANNIGHDDFGRKTPDRDNLPWILEAYKDFLDGKEVRPTIIHNEKITETMTCPMQFFVVSPDEIEDRIDAFYYCPDLRETWKKIKELAESGKCDILDCKTLNIVPNISDKEVENFNGRIFKYIEVGEVSKKGDIIRYQEDEIKNLPTRARKLIKENDVIIARIITSLGNNAIIPKEFSDHLASTGFIVIRAEDEKLANVLWAITRDKIVSKQMYYISTTAIQRDVSETLFKEKILIPIPKNTAIGEMIDNYKLHRDKLNEEIGNIASKILDELS